MRNEQADLTVDDDKDRRQASIDAAARARTSINTLLAWQQLESSRPVTIQFP